MPMASLMRYHGYGPRPCCEVVLDSGDHLLITVESAGVVIKRLARAGTPEEILFVGPVHMVGEICAAVLNGKPASEITVIDIFLAVVSQFRSASDVKAAFTEVSAQL